MATGILQGGSLTVNGVAAPMSLSLDEGTGLYSFNTGAEITLDPTNLATSAKQDTLAGLIGALSEPSAASVNGQIASIVTATEAGATQTTAAAILAKIIAAPATEAQIGATSNPASGTVNKQLATLNTAIGTISDAAWESGNGTVISILKAIHGQLATIASNTTPA